MSFVLMLFPAAVAVFLRLRRTAPAKAIRVLATGAGTVALVLALGALRLARSPAGPTVKVGLVAADALGAAGPADPDAKTLRIVRDLAGQADALARSGAQLIVLPEKIGFVADPGTAEVDALLQPIADATRAWLVVGLVHATSAGPVNTMGDWLAFGTLAAALLAVVRLLVLLRARPRPPA
jgi:apolipoprotein N-acyltransferase